jgi:hypothetical protein
MPLVCISESRKKIIRCIRCEFLDILSSKIKELQNLYHLILPMDLPLFLKLTELSNSISKHNLLYRAKAQLEFLAKLGYIEVLLKKMVLI